MRFWIGLLLGLCIGVFATAAYYEIWDVDAPDEIGSRIDDR
jgi:hypothetical protein